MGARTSQTTEDKIYELYTKDNREITEICRLTKVAMRTVYDILTRKGVIFRSQSKEEAFFAKENRLAEVLKTKFLDIKREFPDFDIELTIKRIFSKRGIGSEKVLRCFKDPIKLDKRLVEKSRSWVFFILNGMTPEDVEKASLNVKMQMLPILLEIAGGKYPLQPDRDGKVDPKRLKQNILIMIQNIQKSDPLVTQEIKDMLTGVKKATEDGRLLKEKDIADSTTKSK